MSDNVLRFMSHNMWCLPLYNRKELLVQIYRENMPDVLCLQEVTYVIHNQGFLEAIGDEYVPVIPKQGEYFNNTPILYKKTTFDLVESGWHLFDGKNNADTKSITWAVLCRKSDSALIGVCSAHFWWEAASYEDDCAREYDAQQSLAYVNYIRHKYKAPVIFGGDLNCKIGSPAYNCLVANGGMDARIAAKDFTKRINTWHDFPPFDKETCLYSEGGLPSGTHLDAIDHIFVFGKDSLDVECLEVVDGQTALVASDHLAMYIDFEIRRV